MDSVIVEVLDRRGRVWHRTHVGEFPATLGRAPSCTVMVADLEVSSVHARLERDEAGALWLVDLQSRNGLWVGRTRQNRVRIEGRITVRIGLTPVRFGRDGDAVEVTREVPLDSPLENGRLAVAVWLLAVVVNVWDTWTNMTRVVDWPELVWTEGMPVTLVVFAWATVWSIASRVARARFHFYLHWTVTMITFIALPILSQFSHVIDFGLGSPALSLLVGLIAVAPGGWCLTQQLRHVASWSRRQS